MNKIEAVRGFITFFLIALILISVFFTIKFIASKKTFKEDTEAVSNSNNGPTIEGYTNSLGSFDSKYDLNNDGIINSYDYYLLQLLINQTPNNN